MDRSDFTIGRAYPARDGHAAIRGAVASAHGLSPDERIASALERIAAALERMNEARLKV